MTENELTDNTRPEAFVILGGSSSQCSACHGNASPHETSHIHGGPKSGWTEGSDLNSTNGCGAVWTKRVSYYSGSANSREILRQRFPDLPFEFSGELA